MPSSFHVKHSANLADVPDTLWQSADSPFTSKAFWQALEDQGHIGAGSDWESRYLVLWDVDKPLAMLPVFVKEHHAGEYVFDHAWAQAFHRHHIGYYPRLVTSVPFTPVVGQRIWLANGITLTTDIINTLMQAVDTLAGEQKAPTWHGLFIEPSQCDIWKNEANVMDRNGCQFLWHNQSHTDKTFTGFDDFLAKLTAKKRKNIRAERRKVAATGVTCQIKFGVETKLPNTADINISSDTIDERDWQVFYQCYAMTYAVHGQHPYLSLAFFEQLGRTMPEHIALAQAVDEAGNTIACALFFYDDTTLYGRYWGALEEVNFLHFELCYYQGISLAIALGVERFDPGTQGEHKLIRGFEPTTTQSLHKCYVDPFVPAIEEFCRLERADIARYKLAAQNALPFKDIS